MTRFWLNRGTQPEGPLDEAAIAQLIAQGLRQANVCPDGGQGWQPLASHPPFAAALAMALAMPATNATPALATPSPSADPSDPAIVAHVARGFSTPFTTRLVVQSLLVVGYTLAALVFTARGNYPTSWILLIYGIAVLGAGLNLAQYRIVGTPTSIGPVLGRRYPWADLEGPQRMKREIVYKTRSGIETSRSVRVGLRLHFRGGRKLDVWDDWKAGIDTRLEAYAAMAGALAQPARARELLAVPSLRAALEADRSSTDGAPALRGGLVALVFGSFGLLCFAAGGVMHVVERSRHAADIETARSEREAAAAARAAEEAATAAAAAAYASSHPPSPGLVALTHDQVCPLLTGWGYACTEHDEPPARGAVPPFRMYTITIGTDRLRARLVDYSSLPAHRILDAFAVSVIAPDGVETSPILDALTRHPITGWPSFEAAVRRTRYRFASGTSPRGGFGFVCESFPASHGSETVEISECNWALVGTGVTSMRVETAGDHILVLEDDAVRSGPSAAVERLRTILMGTATP